MSSMELSNHHESLSQPGNVRDQLISLIYKTPEERLQYLLPAGPDDLSRERAPAGAGLGLLSPVTTPSYATVARARRI